jgi:DNA-binding FrmR family transcriptional regulator
METDKNENTNATEETMAGDGKHCCCNRIKERSEKEQRALISRLNRIEGQIRGIRGMVERNCYCPDIMIQVASANAALTGFNKALLAEHIRSCVATDIREGRDETVEELVETLQKVMK